MKKLLCALLCLLLCLPTALADGAPVKLSESEPLYTSLYERSMELAYLFDEALRRETRLTFSDAFICPDELTSPCFVLMQYGVFLSPSIQR